MTSAPDPFPQNIFRFTNQNDPEVGRRQIRRSQNDVQSCITPNGNIADFQLALVTVLRQVVEATRWSFGEAWIPNADQSALQYSGIWYGDPVSTTRFRQVSESLSLAAGIGLPGRVWVSQQPEWQTDLQQPIDAFIRAEAAAEAGFNAAIAVPVVLQNRVLAVLVFFMHEARMQDRHMAELVVTIAAQLGTVFQLQQTETALGESQQRLTRLINSLPGIVFTCSNDSEWSMTYLSEGCKNLLGYSSEELIGPGQITSYNHITHADDLVRVLQSIQQAIVHQQPYVVEYRISTKSGEEKWLWEKGYGVFDANHQVLGLEGFITDITSRKQIEEALRESEERFRAVFEHATVGISLAAANGSILQVNPALETMLGYGSAELCQMKFSDYTHPQDLAVELALDQELIAGDRDHYQIEKKYIRKDGQSVWVRMARSAVRDAEGMTRFTFTIAEDITERKQAEKALQEHEYFLRLVLDNIPQHIFWKDCNLVYRGSNKTWATYAGLEHPEAAIGKTDFDFWSPEIAEAYRRNDRQIIESCTPKLHIQLHEALLNGQMIWKDASKVPIHDADGQVIGVLGMFEDITQRKQAEEALEKRERYLATLVEIHKYLLEFEHHSAYARVLELLGKISGASRVYLFRNHYDSDDRLLMSQIAEWCTEGIIPEIDNPILQNLSYDDWCPRWAELLSSNQIINGIVDDFSASEQEILKPQGILSILILPFMVNGTFAGFIGFDNCAESRLWAAPDIDLLKAAATAIASTEERWAAVEALQESERRYRFLAQNSTDLMARLTPDGIYLYVSPACRTLLGYESEELLGQSVYDLIHPRDLAQVQRSHFGIINRLETDTSALSYRIRQKNGRYIWFETTGRVVCDSATDVPQEFVTVSRNITERREAANWLAGQKRVLEMIATDCPLDDTLNVLTMVIERQCPDSFAVVMLLMDLDRDQSLLRIGAAPSLPFQLVTSIETLLLGEATRFSAHAQRRDMLIIPDITTNSLWRSFHEAVPESDLRACWAVPIVSSQERSLGMFVLLHRHAGTPKLRDLQLMETATQLAGIAIEQKRVDEALKQAEKKYRSIFENAVEGIFQTTVEGHYLSANPMLAQIYGYSSPEEMTASLTNIEMQLYVDPRQRAEFVRRMNQENTVLGFESQIRRKDGEIIWISECARAVRNAQGQLTGYEGTVEDITHRKLAETELHHRDRLLRGVAELTHCLLTNPTLEEAIPEALKILGQAAEVDRVYIYRNHPHLQTNALAMSMIFEWAKENIPPSIYQPHWQNQLYSDFGMTRWQETFAMGRSIHGITRDFPPAEQEILSRDGILAILLVPIFVDDQLWGYIGFDDCTVERCWSASDESILVTTAASIGGAIKRQRTEAQMRYQAFHDALTGLPNRSLFDQQLASIIAQASPGQDLFAVAFLDLDRFKTINDTLGHTVGDELLKMVTQRLNDCLRKEDTIARWGGDEFTMILPYLQSPEAAAQIAQRISDALKSAFYLAGHELHITGSIGIALYPQDGEDLKTLLQNADAALYRVKEQGRDSYQFYTATINSQASELLTLGSSLYHALERQEFVIHYQPQVDTITGEVIQMEALLRWQHPAFGLVSPLKFIPLAEENGLIIPIGEWVLRTACAQTRRWQAAGLPCGRVAVNLSARQFQQQGLVQQIAAILHETDLAPDSLELEITETAAMQDLEFTKDILRDLNAMGVRISMDDFGTGYSSLNYLKLFPLHALKIDRSFIQDLATNTDDAAIVKTIITLGHGLQLQVVAEGVETDEQVNILRSLRCDAMQGYLFSKPLSVSTATQFLQRRTIRSCKKSSSWA